MAEADSGEPVMEDAGDEGLQQVAVVNEHGETIYVQLPPNITLDGNSVVTTETTEDGHQILRIIAHQQDPEEEVPTPDQGVHSQEAHTEESEDQGVDIIDSENQVQEVHLVQPEYQQVHVIQPEEPEEHLRQSDESGVQIIQTEEQGVHMVQTDEHGVHVIQPEEQEVHIVQAGDHEVHMDQEGVDQQGPAQEVQVMEMETDHPGVGQEIQVIQVGEDQQHEVQVIRVGGEDQQVRVIQMAHAPSNKDIQVLQMGDTGDGDGQEVRVIQMDDNEEGRSQQDLQLFQQAMALIQQQTAAGMVVPDQQQVVVAQDGGVLVGPDGQVVMSQSEYDENTVYVVQQDTPIAEGESSESPETLGDGEEHCGETPEGMVQIINPETGRVETIAKSSLDTIKVPETILTAPTNLLKPDPVCITPVKRKRGRPRKNHSLPPPLLEPKVEEPPSPVVEDLPVDQGRPRRKSALKFLKSMKMRNQQEENNLKAQPPSPVARPRSYTRRAPSVVTTNNKENIGPAYQPLCAPNTTSADQSPLNDHPTSVNITIKDRAALQVLSDIGIHLLYYCRRCTFFSTQLMAVTDHIASCRKHPLSDNDRTHAADAANATLLHASLQAVAEKGERDEHLGDLDEDQIQIDEHNYAAEVDLVEEESEMEGQAESAGELVPEPTLVDPKTEPSAVPCHLCGQNIVFSGLAEHLRVTHSDMEGEEAARAIEALGTRQMEGDVRELEGHVGVEGADMEVAMEVPVEQSSVEVVQSMEEVQTGQHQTDPSTATPLPEAELTTQPTTLVPAGRLKFRCPDHELTFTSQAEHTQHYMEVHWGVTSDQGAQTEEKQSEPEVLPSVPVKRGRGRPPKYPRLEPKPKPKPEPISETLSDYDDDVADPDFDIKSTPFLPRFRVQPGPRSSAKCKFCYKTFASSTNLQKHIRDRHSADKMKPLPCTVCGKLFRNSAQRRNHQRTVHEGKKRKYIHRNYPTKRKTYMCESCGYTTPELIRLRNHKLSVHEGKYPYECTICDYKTNEKADLRRHENKHQGIRRYACQFCTYRSDQRWLLVNHCLRQHSIQLEKNSRNTRGSIWSSRRKRRDEMDGEDAGDPALAGYTQEIIIEPQSLVEYQQHGGESYLVPMVTTNEHGEETVTMYAVQQGDPGNEVVLGDEVAVETVTGLAGEVAVETVGEEEAHAGGVVYLQEDGTILETTYS